MRFGFSMGFRRDDDQARSTLGEGAGDRLQVLPVAWLDIDQHKVGLDVPNEFGERAPARCRTDKGAARPAESAIQLYGRHAARFVYRDC